MKNEIEKIGAEMRGEKVGIETLKKVQFVKAKLIKQGFDTFQAAKNKSLNGFGVVASWIDDFFALGDVLGRYKKIGAEWQDLDTEESTELKAYFVECLKGQGFAGDDIELLVLAAAINDHIENTAILLKTIGDYVTQK